MDGFDTVFFYDSQMANIIGFLASLIDRGFRVLQYDSKERYFCKNNRRVICI